MGEATNQQRLIPVRDLFPAPLRIIGAGPLKGKACHYKTALFNTLIHFQPRVCLEIGTHLGGTTAVFNLYFERYRPDGKLITADIKKYADLESARVRQVLVNPHTTDIKTMHKVEDKDLLSDYAAHTEDSLERNTQILRAALADWGETAFDFCFLDGDHQAISFMRDLQIALTLLRPPHRILIDDTKEELHDCASLYREAVCPKMNHYDFEDWDVPVSCGLVWSGSP